MSFVIPKYSKFLISVFLVFVSFSFAQNKEFIIGNVIDAKTQEPIAFANIRIKDKSLGVISNSDGSFKIPIKYREHGDIIEISSMGYELKEFLIKNFLIDTVNTVTLKSKAFELEEALVLGKKQQKKEISPEEIVQKSIDNILKNYPVTPYSKVGYYRDYQLDGTEYVNLNEAILEVFDQGFKAMDSITTKVVLYESKQNSEFRRNTFAEKPYDYKNGTKIMDNGYLPSYGGNEFTILNAHNAIRNYAINTYSFINRFEVDFLLEHTFQKNPDFYSDGKMLYSIGFEKTGLDYSSYGYLLISKYDYSIYKLVYSLYDNRKKNTSGINDKNGTRKQLVFEVTTAYQKNEDKMFLSYISFQNKFKIFEPPKLVLETIDLDVEKEYLILIFNNELNIAKAQSKKNYKVIYKGKKIGIDEIMIFKNKVFLYPKLNKEEFKRLNDEIEFRAGVVALNETWLDIKMKRLEDLNGNIINKGEPKSFNQFREFFVQQINLNPPAVLNNSIFMNTRRPIFENQPTQKPDNFDDYWMNTPLPVKN